MLESQSFLSPNCSISRAERFSSSFNFEKRSSDMHERFSSSFNLEKSPRSSFNRSMALSFQYSPTVM